ncbi:MAG: hypothetical protein H0X57_07195 [Rubrobacter sp.]|nr:hypothetical protein [Rubrobacter sp.]
MSERGSGEGNTDAPRVDSEYGERGTEGSTEGGGGSGPRRVGDVREERETGGGTG